ANGAMAVVIATFLSAAVQLTFKIIKETNTALYDSLKDSWFTNIFVSFVDSPFLDRMGFLFIILSFLMVIFSMKDKAGFKWKDQNFLLIVMSLVLFIVMAGGNNVMFHDTVLSMETHLGKTLITIMSVVFIALALFLTYNIDFDDNAVEIHKKHFKSDKTFNLMSILVISLLALIYLIGW
ncbi:MAG: hypothetical protein AAFO69_19665, partial [Bacteroidota bacterium]